jgi:hypothetical protein
MKRNADLGLFTTRPYCLFEDLYYYELGSSPDHDPGELMMDREEKRACTRINYAVPIEISHIRKGKKSSGQSLNHCEGGMCFDSSSSFHPGESLNIRVIDFHPYGPCKGLCEGLRFVTLGEVRWCRNVPDTDTFHYRVGIKFFAPVY